MEFDVLFAKQSLLVKIILLLIPVVAFVTELLVRLSVFLKKKDTVSLLMVVLCVVSFGFLGLVDIVCTLLTGNLLLAD